MDSKKVLLYAAVITITIIVVWILWALFIFKSSDARVIGLITVRHNNLMGNKDNSLKYNVSSLSYNDNGDAQVMIEARRKKDNTVVGNNKPYTYKLGNCSMDDIYCVRI